MAGSIEKRILVRMQKELLDLELSPPEGAICYPVNDNILHLKAEISGSKDTPYEGGIFKLDIHIPEKYPFEPPRCQFITRIYHPNIDDQGRICLNILKIPPNGIWGPAHNLNSLLISLIVLLGCPNPDDPLLVEVAQEFKDNIIQFNQKAREFTRIYASKDSEESTTGQSEEAIKSSSSSLRLGSIEQPTSAQPSTSSNETRTAQPALKLSQATSSTASCPQKSSIMKRSSSKLTLKKPSMKNNAVADSNATDSTTSSDVEESHLLEIPRNSSIRKHEQVKLMAPSETCSDEARPESLLNDAVDKKTKKSRRPSQILDDTTTTTLPDQAKLKRRNSDVKQQQDSMDVSELTDCKKQKQEKSRPSSRHKLSSKASKENIPPSESSLIVEEPCLEILSQPVVARSSHLIPKFRQSQSNKISNVKILKQENLYEPLQAMISSQMNDCTAPACRDSLEESDGKKSTIANIHVDYPTKPYSAEMGQDNKGKGKSKDMSPNETNEGRLMSMYNNSGATSNSISSPLTIAQKRNLLKKNRS